MKFTDLPHGNAALAIFPCVQGFGWMLFDGPLSPVAWSVSTVAASVKGNDQKNARCLIRSEALMHTYRPHTLVLEAFERVAARRCPRI